MGKLEKQLDTFLGKRPRLGRGVYLAKTAVVVGDVKLGDYSSVWYNAVLRGDINRIVVGHHTNIQDNAVLHLADDLACIIGNYVTVGHSAIVHACKVGDEVLVGMGAVILDGAVVGKQSLIGAKALVKQGMEIPPGSLVLGAPAKVVRRLTPKERAGLKYWATKYVANGAYCLKHGINIGAPLDSVMPGRLNIFQRTMLQWNELHPYNAIHVVRIPWVLDPARLGNVIRHLLVRLGLTGLEMDAARAAYDYQGGPAQCEIKLLPEGDPDTTLASEIELQLNTRFNLNQRFNPFRFFILPETDSFSLGLVYFHPVADGEAVAFLLKRIVEAYLVPDDAVSTEPIDLFPPPRDGLLRHPVLLAKKLAALPGMVLNMRRSCRPNYRDTADTKHGFNFFSLPPGTLPKLLQAGKAWDVTLNDLFLAMLARSVAPLAATSQKRWRSELSLGCIVNLRRDLGLQGPRPFGLFLGSFIVTQPMPIATNRLREIAAVVREQTERVKRNQLYLTSALELRFARRMFGFFSTRERRKLYQKHYPLWGGITNMNLNALWPQPNDGQSFDYFRAVSTGPATPLVLSVTTVGENMNLGLTFRRTVFSADDISRIQSELLETVSGRELAT